MLLLTLFKACLSFYLGSYPSRSGNAGIWVKPVRFHILIFYQLLLTDTVPAFVVGVSLGPIGAKLLHITQWGGNENHIYSDIAHVRSIFSLSR